MSGGVRRATMCCLTKRSCIVGFSRGSRVLRHRNRARESGGVGDASRQNPTHWQSERLLKAETMKKRLLLVAACGFCLLDWSWFYFSTPEPAYRGHSLSQWLKLYHDDPANAWPPAPGGRGPQSRAAARAVHQIGTNALPWLLKWTPCEDRWVNEGGTSIRCQLYLSILGEYPYSRFRTFAASCAERLLKPKSEFYAAAAVDGVRILGEQAAPLVPALARLLCQTNAPVTADRGATMLAFIGKHGLPLLLGAITNVALPEGQRLGAVMLVVNYLSTTNLLPAVPFLEQRLERDQTAQDALAWAATECPEVGFYLLTNHPTEISRRVLCDAITRFSFGRRGAGQPWARAAVPWLTEALYDKDERIRESAAELLRTLDPAALINVPPVHPQKLQFKAPPLARWLLLGQGVHAASLASPSIKEWLARSACKAEPQYKGETLSQWLASVTDFSAPSDNVEALTLKRKQCAAAVHSIGTNALPWLVRWLQSTNFEGGRLARRGFGMLRQQASAAVPALLEMVNSENAGVRGRAYSCLGCVHLDWTNTWAALVPILHDRDAAARADAAAYLVGNFPREANAAGLRDFVPAGLWP